MATADVQEAERPGCYARPMAQPDTPNFSPIARVILGVIAIAVIVLLLRYLDYV